MTSTGIVFTFAKRDGGYQFEAAIPWVSLGITPSIGKTIGVTVNIDHIDQGSGLSTSYYNEQPSGGDSKSSAHWAQLVLGTEMADMERQFLDTCDTDDAWTPSLGMASENLFIADSNYTGLNGKKAPSGQLLTFAAENNSAVKQHIRYQREDYTIGDHAFRICFDADFSDLPVVSKDFISQGFYIKLAESGREFCVSFNRHAENGKIYANIYQTGSQDSELAYAVLSRCV